MTVMRIVMRSLPVVALAALSCLAIPAQEPPERESGWLGVVLGGVRDPGADEVSPEGAAVRVTQVVVDSPAMEAGLRAGDIVRTLDGIEIAGRDDLIRRIGSVEPGSWIELGVERKGEERDLRIRLDIRPAQTRGLEVRNGWIGIEAIDLPQTLQDHFGAPDGAGAMVSRVTDGSPGHVAGFELGDVVYEADGVPVRSGGHLTRLIRGGGVENMLEFHVMRDGVEIVLEAEIIDEPLEEDGPADRMRPRDRS